LGGGVIDFKDAKVFGHIQSAVRERVEPRAEKHVLGDSSPNRPINLILHVSASHNYQGSEIAERDLREVETGAPCNLGG
jgi:hypothetical protein